MSQEKLQDLLQLLEVQDILPGTPKFNFEILKAKVTWCQEYQQLPSCANCKQVDDCELSREYRIQAIYLFPDDV